MTFEQPAFLWLLVAAGPVVLLHMHGWRRRRVIVSMLPFWEEAAKVSRFRTWLGRLGDAASLVLHLALLVLLTLGMAGARVDGISHEGERVVLVLDDSAGMAAEGRLARAGRRLARYWRDSLVRNDRVVVRTASGIRFRERFAIEGPPEPPRHVAYGGIRLGERLREIAASIHADRRVVFTDGADPSVAQARGWRIETVGAASSNAGFTAVEVDRPARTVRLRVRNFGREAGRFRVRGKSRRIEGGASAEWVFPMPAREGPFEAELLPRDAFDLDQRAYAWIRPRDPAEIVVLVDRRINPFLLQALDLLTEDRIIDPNARYVQRAAVFRDFHTADEHRAIVVLDHCRPPARIPEGRFLWFGADRNADPVRIARVVEGVRVTGVLKELGIEGSFHVRRSAVFDLQAGQEPLIFSSEGPIAIRGRTGGIVYAAVGFRLSDSDFQLTPLFPQFVRSLILWLQECRLFPEAVKAGETLRNVYPVGGGRLEIGDRETEAREGWVAVPVDSGPGFLPVKAGRTEEIVAVNFFDEAESDIRPKVEGSPESWPKPRWWWRFPTVWFSCAGALALLLCEGFLSALRAGRSSAR